MSIQQQLYPLSTEDGKSIPLDVALPLSSIYETVVQNAATPLTVPNTYDIVSVYSEVDLAIDFTGAATFPLSGNTPYPSMLLVPAFTFLTVRIPDEYNWALVPVKSGVQGNVMITALQKWAGLRLQRQVSSI